MLGPERVRYLAARGRYGTERVSYLAPVGRSTLQSSRVGASVLINLGVENLHFISNALCSVILRLQDLLQHSIGATFLRGRSGRPSLALCRLVTTLLVVVEGLLLVVVVVLKVRLLLVPSPISIHKAQLFLTF
ncbi:hypothetical protein F2Q70_00006765 [Brassica cretica]|uniref:Uncharacterized protein n=1 Tax=Brassica cretica TaxID=69181 RepID=A0A8S9J0M4_BRACR|nr:hypothetical protein F2Q70_00006765 [Brassica cretica]